MKSLLIVFFIAVLILMLTFFPFKVRSMIHLNLIERKCFYCFKFWRIKFLCGRAQIDNSLGLKIENSNNLISGKLNQTFTKNLASELLKQIDVKKIELFFTGGFVDDSYSSAIMCGTVNAFVQSVYSILSQKYKNVRMYEDVTPTFYETNFELTGDVVIKISLFQIFVSLIKASKIKNKELEEVYEN